LGDPPSGALAQNGPARAALVRLTEGGVLSGALAPIEIVA